MNLVCAYKYKHYICISHSPPSPCVALNELIRRLRRIPLDTETATSLVSNLGLDPDDFPELPGYLMKACGVWLEKKSVSCDLEDLVKALVYTKNLGRHTTCLCAPRESSRLRNS